MAARNNLLHKTCVWIFLFLLAIGALILWVTGSTNFRFLQVPATEQYSNFLSLDQSWEFSGKNSDTDISAAGIDIGVAASGFVRAMTIRSLKDYGSHVEYKQGEYKHLLISGTMERISDSAYYEREVLRPTVVVRMVTDDGDLRKGVVVRTDGKDQKLVFSRLLQVGTDSTTIEVLWQLHTAGYWRLSNLHIKPVNISANYQTFLRYLIPYLSVLALIAIIYMAINLHPLSFIVLVCIVSATIALTAVGQSYFNDIRNGIFAVMSLSKLNGVSLGSLNIQKLGHIVAFAMLSIFFMASRRKLRISLFQALLAVLSLAFITEALQRHVITRSSSLLDVGIDSIGILIGLVLLYLVENFRVNVLRINL